jgi:hypothetical protein
MLLATCFFHQEKVGTRRAESDESFWSPEVVDVQSL